MRANTKTDALIAEALGDVWRLKKEVEQVKLLLESSNDTAKSFLKDEIKELSTLVDKIERSRSKKILLVAFAFNLILSSVILFKLNSASNSSDEIKFYKENEKLISNGFILTEAYNSLDGETKQKVNDTIIKLRKNKK